MILDELIRSRRSIRRYEERDVPTEILLRAIETASWTASSGGKQGFTFYLVKNRSKIIRVADAVEETTELLGSWPESAPFETDLERWRHNDAFFRSAPVIIAVAMHDYLSVVDKITMARPDDRYAQEITEARRVGASRLQTAGGAVAYLLLVLHEMGLGACWMAGPLQSKRAIEEILEIPASQHFVALVPVGWPAENPSPKPHKSLEQLVRVIE